MNESDVIRLIKQVIRKEMAQILMGTLVSNQDKFRSTAQRFDESPTDQMRRIQPFGLSSRAPAKTPCLIVPVAGDPSHLNIVGDFDTNKPEVADGEALLYGADGQVIFMKTGGTIHQGTKTAASPVVLGDILQQALDSIIEHITQSTQIAFDSFGLPCILDPTVKVNLTTDKTNYVDDASTNILAQKNFVERGD